MGEQADPSQEFAGLHTCRGNARRSSTNGSKNLASVALGAISPRHYTDGLRKHVHEALGHGVTAADIFEVLQLASVTSLRTLDAALPLVAAIFNG